MFTDYANEIYYFMLILSDFYDNIQENHNTIAQS